MAKTSKKKTLVGNLISLKYTDRPSEIYGIVLRYEDEFTLMRSNPDAYILDGYCILRHKNIQGYRYDVKEKRKEKVLKLKGIYDSVQPAIPLDNLENILRFLSEQYGLFLFHTKSETSCYVGKLISIDSRSLVINLMDTDARWIGKATFRPGDVRVIEFDTDYLKSLQLLANSRKRNK